MFRPVSRPTELMSQRTECSKTFSVGAGRYRALQAAVPIHAFDAEKQEWHEIDARFKAIGEQLRSEGSCLTTVCDAHGIELMDKKGHRLAWTVEDAKAVSPVIVVAEPEENEKDDYALSVFFQSQRDAEGLLTYREIFPGVDMNCRTGFRFYDEFVFASPEAARDIVFCMETGELTARQEENGDIVLTDAEGESIFIIAPPFVCDAKENEGRATFSLEKTNEGYRLTCSPDRDFMAEAAYPVTLDPAVRTTSQNSGIVDTYVRDGYTTDYSAEQRLYVTDNTGYGTRHSLVRVNTLPTLGTSHFITPTTDSTIAARADSTSTTSIRCAITRHCGRP